MRRPPTDGVPRQSTHTKKGQRSLAVQLHQVISFLHERPGQHTVTQVGEGTGLDMADKSLLDALQNNPKVHFHDGVMEYKVIFV